jgi:hypothetical protein
LGRWIDELRESGELGKREWEEILARWGDQLGGLRVDRHELAQRLTEAKAQWASALEASLAHAQSKGTQLLLSLLAQVKTGASALESRLAPQDHPEAA